MAFAGSSICHWCGWGSLGKGGFGGGDGVSGLAFIALRCCCQENKRNIISLQKVAWKYLIFRKKKSKTEWILFLFGAQSAGSAACPPFHYQLSLNSFDHHLNYLLSCPPDGFFANYNFFADGRGNNDSWGLRCGSRAEYTCGRMDVYVSAPRTHPSTLTRLEKTQQNMKKHTRSPAATPRHPHRLRSSTRTRIHTNPHPTSSCGKAIYWPSAEVSSSKVNLGTCLMCSLSPRSRPYPPPPSISLTIFEAERNSFILQIQIHKQSGKMYSYHRWSYYGCGKLSNENIIHCKWHLNTHQQRRRRKK